MKTTNWDGGDHS